MHSQIQYFWFLIDFLTRFVFVMVPNGWQNCEVSSLKKAVDHKTFGDFFSNSKVTLETGAGFYPKHVIRTAFAHFIVQAKGLLISENTSTPEKPVLP